MYNPTQKDHSYLVYHFEMGSVDGTYSNIALRNDEASTENAIDNCGCNNNSVGVTSVKKESFFQSTANKKREQFYDMADRHDVLGIDKRYEHQLGKVHSPGSVYDKCNKTSAPTPSKDRNRSALQCDGGVYVNLTKEERLREGTWHQEKSGNQKPADPETVPHPCSGTQQHMFSPRCCGSVRLIALLQVLIFFFAASSLVLVILIINGTIVCSADTVPDAAKPEKLSDLSSNFREMQAQISKLNIELDNARQELKELKEKGDSRIEDLRRELQEIKNFTQERKAVNNVTAKASDSNDKVDKVNFELMLNSSQQRIITMLSDIWYFVNNTDKEHREETSSLRLMGNSTQEQIQKVSDSLNKLTAKVRKEEQRLNDTFQLKERHSNDMTSLEMLINSSRQDMMNELTRIWTSVNSTSKDLRKSVKVSWLAVLNAVNNTKMQLQQKVNNISKMAGPIGPPGFNGSQGPAGPAGSIGAPGSKGAGDFSACKYQKVTGTTNGGDSADANVDEPSGSIIMAATCSTNYALEYNLVSTVLISQTRRYICNCEGNSGNFSPVNGNSKNCYLHYWLCPTT